MANNTHWSADDLKKKGLIEVDGVYVPAKDQVAKGNVIKLPNLVDTTIQNGPITKVKFGVDMFSNKSKSFASISIPQNECYGLPSGELLDIKYSFDLTPMPAPRMTRSDQWKTNPNHEEARKRQRKPVARYFAWCNAFMSLCKQNGYTLQETLRVVFIMPMPTYLSRKNKEMRLGQPHKQRPDTDNMLKSIKDAFDIDDGFVWDERGVKVWGYTGKILIF